MLSLNKRTETKPKPKPTLIFKNCSYTCAYDCACAYMQHIAVFIIFPLILQTITVAQMMSILEGRGARLDTTILAQ